MLIVKNTFLELPLQSAIAFYNDQIIPRTTQKNKAIAISVAVALSLVYFIREKILRPPKNTRHIPHISIITLIRSVLRGDSVLDRTYNIYIPKVRSAGNSGLYSEYSMSGWVVNVSNPEVAKTVFSKTNVFLKYNQTNLLNTLLGKFFVCPNLLFSNGHEWRSMRKVANPAFHRSMPIKLFGNLTKDLFKAMESLEETVNVSNLMERWTLDVIGKSGFGFDFQAVDNSNNKWVVNYDSLKDGFNDPLFFLFPRLETTYLWMFPKRKELHKRMDEFLKMLDDVIKHKKELLKSVTNNNDVLEDNEKDLLTLMIESINEDGEMSDLDLKRNLSLFFNAGHDTTANTLSCAIHYLAENPEIQQRAREEVIDILGDDSCDIIPSLEDIKKMTYITQIIKETLRMNAPVTKLFPRIVAEDTELSGTFIPKGTQISINVCNIHHNDDIWEDSKTFNPDRFSESVGTANNSAWLPFGSGTRKCIATNFSIVEQRVMLSMLLRKFTWETPANSVHKNGLVCNTMGIITGPINLDITFHRRY